MCHEQGLRSQRSQNYYVIGYTKDATPLSIATLGSMTCSAGILGRKGALFGSIIKYIAVYIFYFIFEGM